MKIGVLGLWHLGSVYSACLAELGHYVIGISDDRATVDALRRRRPSVAEPQLVGLITKNQKRRTLVYDSDFSVLGQCDVVWVAIDTPVDENDQAQIQPVFDYAQKAARYFRADVLLVVSSQLSVGMSQKIVDSVKKWRPGLRFFYAYVPENLRLGEAVHSFFEPGRIVIGSDHLESIKRVQAVFRDIKTDFLPMRVASAEMTKHALNSFLATSLSFIYDIADVCEKTGADIVEVARALRSDARIGHGAYLDASIGFSGGTLARDLSFLVAAAKRNKISVPVIRAVLEKNRRRRILVIDRLASHVGDLRRANVAILGLTYKSGTNTLRRSLALEIAADLYRRGAKLALCDPAVDAEELKQCLADTHFSFSKNWQTTVKGCQAALVVTPWPTLRAIDFRVMQKHMKTPAVLLDARNFFSMRQAQAESAGLMYLGIGR